MNIAPLVQFDHNLVMIFVPIAVLVLAATTFLLGYRYHQRRYRADLLSSINNLKLSQSLMEDMRVKLADASQRALDGAQVHAINAALAIEVLDGHVVATGQSLDHNEQAIIDQMRGYYSDETLH